MNPIRKAPSAGPALNSLFALAKDPLGLAERATREAGDIVRFQLGPQVIHLLNHPDYATQVLKRNRDNYDKASRSTRYISRVCGDSLLCSNGEFWKRQRQFMQSSFHGDQVRGYVELMSVACQQLLDEWERGPEMTMREVSSEMMRLTYTIVARALFGADLSDNAVRIKPSIRYLLDRTFKALQRVINAPGWIPTPGNRRFAKALREMDEVVYDIIDNHQPSDDLLTTMLEARDPESGEGLTRKQVRNETITLLISGHETTANALSWTFHLLSKHPEFQEQAREEVANVLGGRSPTLTDISNLNFVTQVIRESMRLYPPIWLMERHVINDDTINGFHIPQNSSVVVCQWTMHRHPKFWDEPEAFRPSRFDGAPTPAYLPFGAGPRFCIGNEFALLEAKIITAMILQRYRIKPVEGARIEPFPGITLPPRHGMPLQLERLSSP